MITVFGVAYTLVQSTAEIKRLIVLLFFVELDRELSGLRIMLQTKTTDRNNQMAYA